MPTVKSFEKKSAAKKNSFKSFQHEDEEKTRSRSHAHSAKKPNRRRPGRSEDSDTEPEYVKTMDESHLSMDSAEFAESEPTEMDKDEKFHLEFYGSEMLRTQVPQAFDLAEAIVEDWQKNGNFQALPLKNPWAQLVASESLKRAKKVERKLENAGVIPMAKMGLEFLKSKFKK